MRRITNGLIGLLALVVAGDLAGQWNVARFGEERNRMYTSFGFDPALVSAVGYGRVIPLFGHPFQFTGEVGLAAAHLDTRDFRARVGAETSVLRWRSLHLTGSATFITRGTENAIYRGLNFGADLTGRFGVYRRGWFLAGEFGFDKAIITHLTHSDWYREHYYAGARDGWYLDAGGTYHYGATAGIGFGRLELTGRFNWVRTEEWDALPSPVVGSVGVGVRF